MIRQVFRKCNPRNSTIDAISVHYGGSRQAVDPSWNLWLVHVDFCLFSKKFEKLEGKNDTFVTIFVVDLRAVKSLSLSRHIMLCHKLLSNTQKNTSIPKFWCEMRHTVLNAKMLAWFKRFHYQLLEGSFQNWIIKTGECVSIEQGKFLQWS